MVSVGDHLTLSRLGGSWRVGNVLGQGGQGAVYELIEDPGQRSMALKWYRPEATHVEQRAALARLTDIPPPSASFLWPIEMVDGRAADFGYVMPLRPIGYTPLADLLTGRLDVPFSVVVRVCLGLADSFLLLHTQGMCYRDISLGNVFFSPLSGHPLICDNDNVGIEGRDQARVLGTSRFMAPEIVRGEALPSTATDLYSLAVLIFYVLMVHHPLLGRRELEYACLDRAAESTMFGTSPLFVFDPVDDSNAPDPVVHNAVTRYWPLFPSYVRAEFTKAFTVGLNDPNQRVRETVWRRCMSRVLDGIVICGCGKENFTDDGAAGTCWSCGRQIPPPVRLDFGGRVLVLNTGSKLTRHHIDRDYDYTTVLGEVVQHPDRPDVWGLKNVSERSWVATLPSGVEKTVEPGRSVGLVPGTRIQVGKASALVAVG